MKYFLAIDLGASNGRHVIGYYENNEIVLKDVYRFKTIMDESADGLVWNLERLFNEIKNGIKKAFLEYPNIESLAIDTWGVDYVLMANDKEIKPFYAYRNERNIASSNEVHNIISFKELYNKTGIQFAPFNTIYQLYSDKLMGRLDNASDYLMLPSYFTYKLTGKKVHEYTNESTTSLLDPYKMNYSIDVINKLGLPKALFNGIVKPGYFVGALSSEIEKEVGGNTKVVMCASHDTASAFEAIDAKSDEIILSSGTWSLLGVKNDQPIITKESQESNYTNEGGVGYIRLLKNIMGMYIPNRVKNELGLDYKYIDSVINGAKYNEVFDVNDSSLLAPKSMRDALLELLDKNPPKDDIELFVSIFNSLALSYKRAIEELELITGKSYSKVIVVGGGAKNSYLNNLIEEYTKKQVVTLPIEATALGNIMVQMKASKDL